MDRKRKPIVKTKAVSAAGPSRRGADEVSSSSVADSIKGGLKKSTIGTTLYLLPDESWRLKQLAVTLRISMHDLILRGLDKVLEENGQPILKRYVPGILTSKK